MKRTRTKLEPLPKIRRRLMRLWSERVRSVGQCEVCRAVGGSSGANGKPIILNAHHCWDRAYGPLRFDLRNGLCVCASCHKWNSKRSAHRNPVWFVQWLRDHKPEQYAFLAAVALAEEDVQVDLDNRTTLAEIERRLTC